METLNIRIKSLLKRKAGIADHVLELGRNRWFAALICGLGRFTLGELGNLCMNGFFRRFFHGDFGPPPPPDLSNQPTISGQTVAEMLYHDSKHARVVITCDQSGTYRIHKQFWDTSDWKAGYGASWRSGGNSSFTDSIEIARNIAREELNC